MSIYYLKHYGFCDKIYISHHGIKGQKWGERNGPPYPLSDAKHERVVYGDSRDTGKIKNLKKRSIGSKAIDVATMVSAFLFSASTAVLLPIPYVNIVAAGATAHSIESLGKKVADKYANKKVNEIQNLIDSNTKTDKKTGLKLKTEEMTKKQDLKASNILYGLGVNSVATNNCGNCSIAYELRRRGFDVTSKLNSKGVDGQRMMNQIFPSAKSIDMDDFGIYKILNSSNPDEKELKKARNKARRFSNTLKIKKQLKSALSEQPNSRGILLVQWFRPGAGGHATTYEVTDKGKINILDPQSGEKMPFSSVANEIIAAKAYRLDDVENFNANAAKEYIIW